ncbi:CBS domain-containing protein [Ferrimonas sediminicola]|uniref:CBS domain-containing protein n=1 Tax=Ferrimonas sediminicola TaxID=2569538 RepID=A0A4U1BG19_9GAMM|nr:CBS domain-containing protein [Ferrimonas sediminicola]TKB49890.1 CBS domain-containing protein [Ferrimonas sediminicola]
MPQSLSVANVMHDPELVLHPDTDAGDALDKLLQARLGAAPVVDAHGRLVGVLSEHDLLLDLWYHDYQPEQSAQVRELMQRKVTVLTPRDDLLALAERICIDPNTLYPIDGNGCAVTLSTMPLKERARAGRVWHPRHFPVVEEGQLVGMVSRRDLVGALRHLYRHRAH